MTDKQTLNVYDEKVSDYEDVAINPDDDPVFQGFAAALVPGGRVLDLGAGPGHLTAALIERGFAAEAWDASEGMVAAARSRNVPAVQATFSDLEAVAHYDGVLASFSLLHAREADLSDHLAAIHRALKPGGVFQISMKIGNGEERDSLGRFYTYVTEEGLDTLLHAAGFTPVDRVRGKGPGLSGRVDPWISVRARA